MIRTSLALLFTILISGYGFSQNGIPTFHGMDLNDGSVNMPEDALGKKTLIGFAFSPKAQEDLESWAQPVYDEFIDKESLAAMVYDANVYLVIVFNKINSSVRKKAIKEMKENILPEFYGNIILSDVLAKEIKKELEIKNNDVPAIYTLDENGKITSTSSGRYSSKKLENLSNYLEKE